MYTYVYMHVYRLLLVSPHGRRHPARELHQSLVVFSFSLLFATYFVSLCIFIFQIFVLRFFFVFSFLFVSCISAWPTACGARAASEPRCIFVFVSFCYVVFRFFVYFSCLYFRISFLFRASESSPRAIMHNK